LKAIQGYLLLRFMHRLLCRSPWSALLSVAVSFTSPGAGNAQVPLPVQTNSTIRVMAANITTGNNQRYEAPGLRIFKALKPDIVAVQEFNDASTNGAGTGTEAYTRRSRRPALDRCQPGQLHRSDEPLPE